MHLSTRTRLPLPIEGVFAFFSQAENLQSLTPDWLRFEILTPGPIAMRQGTLIDYRIRLHGVALTWRSEITVWNPPHVFVDAQVRGPYRRWVHTHRFTTLGQLTLIDDEVDFDMLGGRLVSPFVGRDLRAIFGYRHTALRQAFNLAPEPAPYIAISTG